jgi:hypothetical protein
MPPHRNPAPAALDYAAPVRARTRRSWARPTLVTFAGLLLFPLVVLAAYPVAALVPWGWKVYVMAAVPHWQAGRPPFEIIARGRGYGPFARITFAAITRRSDDGPESWRSSMTVNLEAMTFRDWSDVPYAPLTREAMLDFVSQGQPPPVPAGPTTVADALLDEIRRLFAGQLPTAPMADLGYRKFPSVTRGMSGRGVWTGRYTSLVRTHLWAPWYTPFCVPPWIVACWLLSRRLLRRPGPTPGHFQSASPASTRR